jgi:xanthine dehydrogenase accessory factor
MESIYLHLNELLTAGEKVAVATVIDVRGSVPREVGAKMIIHPLGQHVGTVGGGCGEGEVIRAGLGVIQSGKSTVVHVDLTEDVSLKALGVCGGTMEVFVTPASPNPVSGELGPEQVGILLDAISQRRSCALLMQVRGANCGQHEVIFATDQRTGNGSDHNAARQALESRQHRLITLPDEPGATFVEVQRRSPELVIVGAGHIAVPLAQIAAIADFAVTVVDDRPIYANRERFPAARRVIAAPLRQTLAEMPMDLDTFVVLVTRGHSQDVECLLEILDRPLGYVGMIGSRRRVDAVFSLLSSERGIPPEAFDRVYAPIGLAIGARTPAEIAICIMAEIINVLRGGPAHSIAADRRERDIARRSRAGMALSGEPSTAA